MNYLKVIGQTGPRNRFFGVSRCYATFEQNFSVKPPKKKAWEGQDKDEFFKRYAWIHAQRKDAEAKCRKQIKESKKTLNERSTRAPRGPPPISLNPALEYLYGESPIRAALRSKVRPSFGRLFVSSKTGSSETAKDLLKLARSLDIPREYVSRQELNQMTGNAVHNGFVLETKPLQVSEAHGLSIDAVETPMGREPLTTTREFPIGVYIDEVSDPRNLGALLRTASFMGADFVVLSKNNSAKLSPLVAKAASGAVDEIPIYESSNPLGFVTSSAAQGWTIIGTVAPGTNSSHQSITDSSELSSLAKSGPCLLIIGSEGDGLRKSILDRCSTLTTIKGGQNVVDSLNVSVACGILLSKMIEC